MPIIVDTYNVLHVVGILPPDIAGIDTAELVDLVRQSRFRFDRVTLVCDGTPGPGAPVRGGGPVTIRYAGGGVTADDVIARMVRKSSTPRRLTVVSSDRAVLREARRRRAATMRSEAFLRLLALDHRAATDRPAPRSDRPAIGRAISDEHVDHWLTVFEITDADDVSAFLPAETPEVPAPEPTVEEPAEPAPEPTPMRPKKKPAPPILPLDLVAEAARMVEEAAAEDAVADTDTDADADADTDADADADTDAGTDRRRAATLASLFPPDLLAAAEALTREPDDDTKPEIPERGPARDTPPPARSPQPARDGLLPDDLLAEAEALWRESMDEPPGDDDGDGAP